MKFFLFLFFTYALCLLSFSNAFAQQQNLVDNPVEEPTQTQEEALQTAKEVEQKILEELSANNYFQFSPLVDLFLGVSVGVSAFELQDMKNDIDQYTEQLSDNLNELFISSEPYLDYKKKFAPPFFFSLDFKVFRNWYGFGISYDRHFTVTADYQIGTLDGSSTNTYNIPLSISYTMYSDGFRVGPWFRKKVYIPQVQLLASMGYSYGFGRLNIKFDGGNTFESNEQNYKNHSHGFYTQFELMIFYRNLTYGLGVLFEGRRFDKFSNDQGIFYGQNGEALGINMLEVPMVYLRIGAAF